MIYMFCPRRSNGARDLAAELAAVRLRQFDGMDFWFKGKRVNFQKGDVVINWGAEVPNMDGIRVLNAIDNPMSKYEQGRILMNYVLSVQVTDKRPAQENLGKFIGRRNGHQGGSDLLVKPVRPDFWSLKEIFVNEYRIHSFNGKSIRAGKKIVREGFTLVEKEADWKPDSNLAHPWVRSFDGGWRINYDGFKSSAAMRDAANKALAALKLNFGAVDLGVDEKGNIKVIEVNTAPGIEGNSVKVYAEAILGWINEVK